MRSLIPLCIFKRRDRQPARRLPLHLRQGARGQLNSLRQARLVVVGVGKTLALLRTCLELVGVAHGDIVIERTTLALRQWLQFDGL